MMEYIDANIFCYLLSENREFADSAQAYFDKIALGLAQGATSVHTLAEVCVTLRQWFKWSQSEIAEALDLLLTKTRIRFLPLTEEIMLKVPGLMESGMSYGDSIHLATMRANGITEIVSEDKHFDRISGIKRLSVR